MAFIKKRYDCYHVEVCNRCGKCLCPEVCSHYTNKFTSNNTASVAIALLDRLSAWDNGGFPGVVDMPQCIVAEWRKATAPVAQTSLYNIICEEK